MAYDRYDPEQRRREGRRDFNEERGQRESWGRDHDRGRTHMDRGGEGGGGSGFFERMGEEVRSWFGDEDDDRGNSRHREDDWRSREHRERSHRDDHARPQRWSSSNSDYNRDYRQEADRGGYRPMAGDYARSGDDDRSFGRDDRSGDQFERDPYRRTSFAGSRERSNHDPHYSEWRRRQMDDLDREYDDYRRERQSRFEDDFGGWRERRQSKRQLLSGIREHMEVVGKDEKHVGTVDRVAGDRIILTKSDPEAGGAHHSLSCTDVDRVEDNRVILDCDADKARERWRDESRSRALFEREDQGDAGPHILDRSFSGTYR